MTKLDNFQFYIEKRYYDGIYELEALELIIDEDSRPYGLLTVLYEYSEQFKVYITKSDINILKDLEPEKALNLLYRWILQGKVHKQKLAHKRGKFWEHDLPNQKDLAVMAKFREMYPRKPFSGPNFVVSKY